jgi:preprotein translocase subunit SecE
MANAKSEGTGNKTVSNWIDGLKSEFRKIIWPDQKSLVKQTGAVVAVSIALGIIITIMDFIFQHGVDILVNISF